MQRKLFVVLYDLNCSLEILHETKISHFRVNQLVQHQKSTKMEEMVGSVKDERRSDGVSEQPAEDLQMIDRLEDIADQMMPDNEKRSDGVPVQPAGVLQIIDILEDSGEQMMQG